MRTRLRFVSAIVALAACAASAAGKSGHSHSCLLTESERCEPKRKSKKPDAKFSATPTSGEAPLTVSFQDETRHSPTSWSWDFGDGTTSTDRNPNHVYTAPGIFTVVLLATNQKGSDLKRRVDYISVTIANTPVAEFVADRTVGVAPLEVQFRDESTNSPTSWSWSMGDGATSTVQNPTHVYTAPGLYSVELTASNSGGSDARLRTAYIEVRRPGPLKIMPFGDSITEARDGWASYRYFLWHQLRASGHCPDFVGSKRGVRSGAPMYPDFDQDHEGHDDHRADELIGQAFDSVQSHRPEVILCHIGSVDLFQGQDAASTILDVGALIDEFRRADPSIKILLAELIPFGPRFPFDVTAFNAALPLLVTSKTTAQSPIVLVDHFSGWIPGIHSRDDVHPNALGETRMANTWHDALLAMDLGCVAETEVFGSGCPGSAGTPTLRFAAGTRPVIGNPFSMELGSLPASTLVLGLIGFDDSLWNGLALPLDLGLIGMPNCMLYVDYRFTVPLASTATGHATWAMAPIPASPALAGLETFFQAAVKDPGQNAFGLTVTNAGKVKLGVK